MRILELVYVGMHLLQTSNNVRDMQLRTHFSHRHLVGNTFNPLVSCSALVNTLDDERESQTPSIFNEYYMPNYLK